MRAASDRRAGARGFTMVELLAYLAIFTVVMGTLLSAEGAARRMNRNEAALLEALGQADRAFALLSEDCDRAVGVATASVKSRKELSFLGGGEGVRWISKDGELLRGKSVVSSFVDEVEWSQPDPVKHPRLLKVKLTFRRKFTGQDAFQRSFERSFLLRNLDGDGRGGL